MRHATDRDHVIAVGTIVARHQTTRAAALIGFAWGLGHSLSILLVGSAIVAFSWVIPTRVGLSMELTVALMLIVLGLANLWHIPHLFGGRVAPADGGAGHAHTHALRHGDYVHTHPHRHDPESHRHRPDQTPLPWLDRHFGGLALYQLVRPLVVGIVHGLAGPRLWPCWF
jgi:high-affinity nickel-transport protein